ncbi:MAG TPA: thiamine phosphate synthase [Epsilonproteobacteria bacterium]|nr:thiamine phosphate synthase [Campylobacterota bacterium]
MIYALVDQETLQKKGVSLQDLLSSIRSLPIPILQYRNKNGSLSEQKEALIQIRNHYDGKVIINDKIELIDLADGLHLGQEDIRCYSDDKVKAIAIIRERIRRKTVGLSTHNAAEIVEANRLDVDYIGLGAYRPTGTKRDAKVMGTSLLEIAKLSKHPVAIIGGVLLEDTFEPPIQYKVIGSGLYNAIVH